MNGKTDSAAFILGIFIMLGLGILGWQLASAALKYKSFERTVAVKGLSEREYPADVVIWTLKFSVAENDITKLYIEMERNVSKIKAFLLNNGLNESEISVSVPAISDVYANQYGTDRRPEYRYTSRQAVTVYSSKVESVRSLMTQTGELGKEGLVLTGNEYEAPAEYIFTRLNEVKPQMIEEATKAAREVAQKFAGDSGSRLGKIKSASQGQFTISARDTNNPHIKSLRVVSTVEYYLSD
ncbi:SIMPL domain-containing protein [Geovibrio thiophilus]|uniref:SIMPL domain-containing protein n=1 Tax=Geovibrio thiophilus TaxID=139438 RepID=A0A410JVQ0_9BACT|nr:SIMPL domain-containing protein [Geovibrio thiophilus]QAR32119.1 SIMPL domain-containing protein [Geovibrio thiophilus]